MRRDTKLALVRLLDDRTIDLRRHLGRGAEIVVDPDLDHVRLALGDFRNHLPRLIGRLRRDDISGDVQPRPVQRRRVLRVACIEGRSLFAAQTPHRRHAISGEHAKLAKRVRIRVGARLAALDVGDVDVRGDQTGDHELTLECRCARIFRDGHGVRSAHARDPAVPDHHDGVLDACAGSVEQRGAREHLGAGRLTAVRRRRAGNADDDDKEGESNARHGVELIAASGPNASGLSRRVSHR